MLGIALALIIAGIIAGVGTDSSPIPTCLCSLGFAFVVASIYEDRIEKIENAPSALDVYRGKTHLEITYKDTVAVDSTVIFINKQ